MNNNRWLVLTLIAALGACKEESIQPELDINGHWNIDHGFYDPCQVNATFTDTHLILSFYSLEEGACQPELYGIENNALAILIHSKQDAFADDGALTTTLEVSVPERFVAGTISLRQTAQGLTGSLTSTTDSRGLLEPLLEPLYQLSPLPDQWLPYVLGQWSVRCEEMDLSHVGTELCELIEFTDATTGRVKSYGGASTATGAAPPIDVSSQWDDVTFALRNIVNTGEGEYELEMVIINPGTFSVPIGLSLSDAGIFMVNPETSERIELLRGE
jgi:hypothetical protein